jgi:hypothetical protein
MKENPKGKPFPPDKTDIDIIRESIAKVVADKELFKKVLINSGIYDEQLKLIKHDRS